MAPKRLSNFELIRVISMVGIICFHSIFDAYWDMSNYNFSNRRHFLLMYSSFGRVGVNLFVMLSGYFLGGKSAKLSSVVRTWIQVLFYSWGICFMFWLHNPEVYNKFRPNIFPVIYTRYWFVTSYLCIQLMSPAIAKMVSNLTRAEFLGLLSVYFVTIIIMNYNFYYAYSPVSYLTFYFLVGCYIKLYPASFSKVKTKTYFIWLMALLLFNFSTIYYFSSNNFEWVANHGGALMLMAHDSSPLACVISIITFLFVSRIEFYSRIVNLMASVSFGVYLIHSNPIVMEKIWDEWIKGPSYFESSSFTFYTYCITVPVFVYFVCGVIDWLRQELFGKLLSSIADGVEYVISSIGQFIISYLNIDEDESYHYRKLEQYDV